MKLVAFVLLASLLGVQCGRRGAIRGKSIASHRLHSQKFFPKEECTYYMEQIARLRERVQTLEGEVERLMMAESTRASPMTTPMKSIVGRSTWSPYKQHWTENWRRYAWEPSTTPVHVPREPGLPRALVGLWPLNGLYGLFDVSGNDNHARQNGNVKLLVDAANEKGYTHFPGGAQDYLEIPNDRNDALKPKKSITMAVLVSDVEQDGPLLDYTTYSGWRTHFWIADKGQVFGRALSESRESWWPAASAKLENNAGTTRGWNWLAFTFDGNTGEAAVWINTVKVKTVIVANASDIDTGGQDIRVGVKVGDNRYLKANIACLMVFNKALNAAGIRSAIERTKKLWTTHVPPSPILSISEPPNPEEVPLPTPTWAITTRAETTTKPPAGFPSGCLGFWPLNGKHELSDICGHMNHATLKGSVRFATGIRDEKQGSYLLPGKEDSYLSLPSKHNSLNAKKSITMAAMIGGIEHDGPIMDYSANGAWATHFWIADGFRAFGRVLPASGTWWPSVSFGFAAAQRPLWHWVALTFDGSSGEEKIWINGAVAATIKINHPSDIKTSASEVRVGARVGDKRYLRARVTCLMIFDRALNEQEMAAARDACVQTLEGSGEEKADSREDMDLESADWSDWSENSSRERGPEVLPIARVGGSD